MKDIHYSRVDVDIDGVRWVYVGAQLDSDGDKKVSIYSVLGK